MSVFCIVNQTVHLSDPTRKMRLDEPLAFSNQRAHSFRVTVLEEGSENPATLTGVGVTGQFMQQGVTPNTTVEPIIGTVNGNVCEVILPAPCYSVPGRFKFTMDIAVSTSTAGVSAFSTSTSYAIGDRVVYNSKVWVFTAAHPAGAWVGTDATTEIENRTVLWIEGIVERNTTDAAIDPGTPVPNITQAINNANAAAATANTAATTAQTAATGAENVDISLTKSGNTITLTATNRDGVDTDIEIEDPSYEVTQKADIDAVTSPSSRKGNPIELTDAVQAPLDTLKITLEPQQDLHGYEKPWVGGSQKNKLRMTLSEVKTANDSWTWNGNTASKNNITVTVNADSDGNVLGYIANANNASAATWFIFTKFGDGEIPVDGTMKFGGYFSSNGNVASTFGLQLYFKNNNGSNIIGVSSSNSYQAIQNNVTSGDTSANYASIVFRSGLTISNLEIKPMILLSSETDYEFVPYSNICPITGYDSVEAVRAGANLYNKDDVVIGKNWVGGSASNRAIIYFPLEKGETYNFKIKNVNTNWVGFIYGETLNNGMGGSPGDQTYSTKTTNPNNEFQRTASNNWGFIQFQWTNGADIVRADIDAWSIIISKQNIQTLSVNVKAANNNTTVYGGTVTINRDGSGTLVVDKYYEQMSDMQWVYNGDGRFKGTPYKAIKGYTTANARTVPFNCSCYEVISDGRAYDATANDIIYYASTLLWVQDNRYTEVEQFKTALAGQTVVYPIENVMTYSLTATQLQTLLGYNRITTDGVTMELTYRKDKYLPNDTLFNQLPTGTASGDLATFSDGADDLPLKKLTVDIQPKQDLHGYDKPWAGGAGKNLCPTMRPENQNNPSYGTIVTTVNDDGSVLVNGSTLSGARCYAISDVFTVEAGTTYVLSGCPSAGGTDTWRLDFRDATSSSYLDSELSGYVDVGSGITVTPSTTHNVRIGVRLNQNITANNVLFKPMIEIGSTATDYVPYSNICPISGWDKVKVTRVGKNLFDPSDLVDIRSYQKNGEIVGNNERWGHKFSKPGIYALSVTSLGANTYYKTASHDLSSVDASTMAAPGRSLQIVLAEGRDLYIYIEPANKSSANQIQLELGSTATAYEPYQCQTVAVNLKTISGSTVYGGTLTVERDGSGTLVVDRAKVAFTGMQWAANGTFANTYNIVLPNTYPRHSVTDLELSKSLSNMYPWYSSSDVGNKDYGFAMSINNDLQFYVKDKDVATVEAANAKFTDLEICYPLHYPATYSLTSDQIKTLLGNNTIWADCGAVTANYYLDGSKPKATTDFLYDLLIALNGTTQQWWAIEGETQTLTQNGLTITRNGTSGEIAFSGKANADTYILINGGTFEAANAPGEWAAMSGFYLYPASLMWSQTMKAPTGMRLIHSTAGWAFDLDMAEEMNVVGGMKLGYGYPDNDGPMYIKVASGTAIPDGYRIQFNLLGTERMD